MIPQRDRVFAPAGLGRLLLLALAWTLAPAPWRSEAAAEESAADTAADGAAAKARDAAPGGGRDKASDAATGRGATRDPAAAARKSPDPLAGTPKIKPEQTGQSAEQILARLTRPRTDSWADWVAPLEPLHYCGEPRALAPCVPPPPCHPSQPPAPYDLVGVRGEPTCGPIYGGPCAPRTGTHDDGPHPRLHRAHDRFFDWFYMWK
jgi:hypothetical protein